MFKHFYVQTFLLTYFDKTLMLCAREGKGMWGEKKIQNIEDEMGILRVKRESSLVISYQNYICVCNVLIDNN